MTRARWILCTLAVVLAPFIVACSTDADTGEHESGRLEASRGEHDRDGGEHDGDGEGHHGEEGEESGTELALNETHDAIRNGVRLVLAYDAETASFRGTVQNTTERRLMRVRVEVHLSSGRELGPTTPADLDPGEKRDVELAATSKDFERWTAHPEVGSGEHAGGEHDREGRGEHRDD